MVAKNARLTEMSSHEIALVASREYGYFDAIAQDTMEALPGRKKYNNFPISIRLAGLKISNMVEADVDDMLDHTNRIAGR